MAPVYKKGEKYNAANYRAVSLTCICFKNLEHIIVSKINKHLSPENILADCQHGFRSQRSCETQLVQFFHNLDRALKRGHRHHGFRLTRYHIRGYFTNCTTTGLEDLLTSGSLHGSLSAIKKWC